MSGMPTPGRWYEGEEYSLLAASARPRRRVASDELNLPLGRPEGARQRFRSRPSRDAVAPWGGRFYWCAFCDYLNTQAEGQAARCPAHRAEYERAKKERQREQSRARQRRSAEAPALTLSYGDIRRLHMVASECSNNVSRLKTTRPQTDRRTGLIALAQIDAVIEAETALLTLIREWLTRAAGESAE